MKLNKIFSTVVAAVMLISSVAVSAITTEDLGVSNSEKYNEKLELFTSLGLISSQVDYSVEKNGVKREDFVIAVLRLADADNVGAVEEAPFTDIDIDYPTAAYIQKGATLGILAGYSDGSFGPKNEIIMEQAVKVIVKLLGYSEMADVKGGYPLGYTKVAEEFGILDGIGADTKQTLTYGDMLTMFENSFEVKVPKMVIEGDNKYIENESGREMLDIYHDIFTDKGIVNANEITALVGSKRQVQGMVKIGDYNFYAGKTAVSEQLGYSVEYYYRKTKNDDIGTILYSKPTDKNYSYTIEDEQLYKTNDAFSYKYYDERERLKTINLTDDKNIIINGIQKPDYSAADLNPHYGQVTLLDNDDDGEYEIIDILSVTDTLVVSAVNNSDDRYTIVDKLDPAKSVVLTEETPATYIIVKDGAVISPIDLTEGTVISVCAGNGYTKILASTETVSGSVKEITGDNKAKIDGIEYDITQNYINVSAVKPNLKPVKVGTTGKFRLDVFGAIAMVDAEEGEAASYAVTIQGYESMSDEDVVILKVFDESDVIKKLNLEKELKVDGKKMKASEALDKLNEKNPKDGGRRDFKQMIKYVLNEEGNISKLYTARYEDELRYEGSFIQDGAYAYYLDTWGREFWENGTKIFCIYENEEDCQIVTDYETIRVADERGGTFSGGGTAEVYFYNKDDSLQVEVGLRYFSGTASTVGGGSVSSSSGVYIVTGHYAGLDIYDQPVDILEVTSTTGGEVKLYTTDDTADGIIEVFESCVPGDMVRFETSNSGNLTGLKKVFDSTQADVYGGIDCSQANIALNDPSWSGDPSAFIDYTMAGLRSIMYVNTIYVNGTNLVGNMPKIPENLSQTEKDEALKKRMYKLGTAKIARVDITNPNKISVEYELSASDIMPGDSVLLDLNQNTMRGVIIVKH